MRYLPFILHPLSSIRNGRLRPMASRFLAHWARLSLNAPLARSSFAPASGDGDGLSAGFARTEQGSALHPANNEAMRLNIIPGFKEP